jgi:hypothetical protein
MHRKRRTLTPFSLSFLDIMSCGLGAVILLFLIIKHNVEAHIPDARTPPELSAEVSMLEDDIREGRRGLAQLRNTVAEIDEQVVIAEGLARRIQERIRETAGDMEALHAESATDELSVLQARVSDLERQKQRLESDLKKAGEDARTFAGEGTRQYLTGLRLEGQRQLILVDVSASMLDKTIVNVIRRRNMPDERKISAAKWRQAVATVDWLTARLPVTSRFQVYLFDTEARPAIKGTDGQWLAVSDAAQLNRAVEAVRTAVPDGGTNLHSAFGAVRAMTPRPDNIILITDGLPTQGARPPRGATVSARDRLNHFNAALKQLPDGIPVNTILLPMEGDPQAAFAFWNLAVASRGTFMTPASDWP